MYMKGKKSVSSCQNLNINVGQNVDGRKDAWRRDFAKHQIAKKNEPSHYKLELDYYLEEPTLPDSDEEFDILIWWKTNGLKYSILQMIARDFLAIPILTVASESSFSIGGRFLTSHRSRLHPNTLESLMCVQDWLWSDIQGSSKLKMDNIKLNTILEEIIDDDVSSFVYNILI
ncbi:uncharacterized protein HKW66_Vig0230830 [Vigna angularis]|uniref:HAT C-terminal dimerisation domain-containing protein n=2 Tax=Phaseolus angularis TaxID=3914 RepID=A0A8T0KBL6_PHAAN|nr:uncharacterized protein HKW66_Vig0230830 [Vigna angularis]